MGIAVLMYTHLRSRTALVAALIVLFSGAFALGATHTIKKGDTLYSLAKRYKTSVTRLMATNGIKDPTKLKIGQRLSLPGSSSSKSTKKTYVSRVGVGKRVIIDPGPARGSELFQHRLYGRGLADLHFHRGLEAVVSSHQHHNGVGSWQQAHRRAQRK